MSLHTQEMENKRDIDGSDITSMELSIRGERSKCLLLRSHKIERSPLLLPAGYKIPKQKKRRQMNLRLRNTTLLPLVVAMITLAAMTPSSVEGGALLRRKTRTPTRSPTTAPTKMTTSPPTMAPTSPSPSSSHPVPPTAGGMPVDDSGGGCSSDLDCETSTNGFLRFCIEREASENVCSECTGLDSDCQTSVNGPYCVGAYSMSGLGCATCRPQLADGTPDTCDVNGSNETCGIPSCLPDKIQYCSQDHEADYCGYMTTTATTQGVFN